LNTSTECPRGRRRGQECAPLRLGQAARERNEAKACDRTLQEQAQNREYRAKYGRTFVTIEPYEPEIETVPSSHNVIFSDHVEQFYSFEEEDMETLILKAVMPPPLSEFDADVPLPLTTDSFDNLKRKWEVDDDVPFYPSVNHCENITWKPAPSRLGLQL